MYALPSLGIAKPVGTFEFLVADPGDQLDPAIDGQFVVYAGQEANGVDFDVLLRDIFAAAPKTLATLADSPDVFSSTAIYRTHERGAGGQDVQRIVIQSWPTGAILLAPPAGGAVSNPVVHSAVAAWEQQNGATGLDIVVSRYLGSALPYVLRSPGDKAPAGDQHSPAASDDLVAYVDDAQGSSVWLHDSALGPSNWTRIADGMATGVSIGKDGTTYVIAVARSSGPTGEDIEIYDRDGVLLAALPAPGPQRNPHIAGAWVAFDDHSSAFSQVVVWRWKTPPGEANLVFVPHPSETDQRLNDITLVLADEVRVVFEDTSSPSTGRDIALYRLPVNPIVFDNEPNGWPIAVPPRPVDCASPDATVLAPLDLTRTKGKPDEASTRFDVAPPAGAATLPVLVCIHAEHVSSAWVLLDDHAVARPDDFDPHVVDLSRPAVVAKGRRSLSARLEGKPGSRLAVRVLADPGRMDGSGASGPDVPPAAPGAGTGGCGNAGAAGSLAALALLLVHRRFRT